jgi:hypothetical protein
VSWTSRGRDRWSMNDAGDPDTLHLLVNDGGRYVELHGTTIHIYDGPQDPADVDYPLGGVMGARPEHRDTFEYTGSLRGVSEDVWWPLLERIAAEGATK